MEWRGLTKMDVRNLLLTRRLKQRGDHTRQSSCASPLKVTLQKSEKPQSAVWCGFCMIPRYSVLVEPHRTATSQEDGVGGERWYAAQHDSRLLKLWAICLPQCALFLLEQPSPHFPSLVSHFVA